jgi:hypothetical protein
MLRFSTCFLLYLRDYDLSATYIIPEASSVLPAGHCMVLHLLAATRLISTNRKASVTTAVLSNTGVLGKILLRQQVPRKRLTNRTYSPARSAIFMQWVLHKYKLSSFCMICCHKFKICTQTSVMPVNWTQQYVTQWGITRVWYTAGTTSHTNWITNWL